MSSGYKKTSTGNSKLNADIAETALRAMGLKIDRTQPLADQLVSNDAVSVVQGDDFAIFIRPAMIHLFSSELFTATYNQFGMILKESALVQASTSDASTFRFLSHYPVRFTVSGHNLEYMMRPVEEIYAKITRTRRSLVGAASPGSKCSITPFAFSVLYATYLSFMVLYASSGEVVHLLRILLSVIPLQF